MIFIFTNHKDRNFRIYLKLIRLITLTSTSSDFAIITHGNIKYYFRFNCDSSKIIIGSKWF